MWFGGWEETLCPVKAPANIVSLAAGENCGREYGGKKLEEVQEGEERKTLSQKKSVEKKKLSIWKKKTFMGRWRDINMHHILVRYSCLGSWELLHYFCNQNQIVTKRTVPGWISLDLIFSFILWEFSFFRCEDLWEKTGRLFLPQGAPKFHEKSLHSIFSPEWK